MCVAVESSAPFAMNPQTEAPCQVQDGSSLCGFENKSDVLMAAWTRAGSKMVFCAWFIFGQGRRVGRRLTAQIEASGISYIGLIKCYDFVFEFQAFPNDPPSRAPGSGLRTRSDACGRSSLGRRWSFLDAIRVAAHQARHCSNWTRD